MKMNEDRKVLYEINKLKNQVTFRNRSVVEQLFASSKCSSLLRKLHFINEIYFGKY